MLVSKLRLIRMKYGISCAELGAMCGLSPQRICQLEDKENITEKTTEKLRLGLEAVLRQRQARGDALDADLKKHGHTLTELVEENHYEL